MAPDAPTKDPTIIKRWLDKVKPMPAAAHPEYELSIETTTGISAPPIGIINKIPSNNDSPTINQKISVEDSIVNITVKTIKEMKIKRLTKCCPKKVVGAPLTKPCNFKNAMIEPVNVMAPIATPIDISTKLALNISPLSLTIP